MRFLKRRREERLYKQWVQHSGLPPGSIPQGEVAQVGEMGGEKKDRLRPYRERLLAVVKKLLKLLNELAML